MKPGIFLLSIMMFVVQDAAFAGEGAVLQKEAGALVITLFTSRTRVTAGPVDIRILLQDRNGLEPVLDTDVSLLLRAERSGAQIEARALSRRDHTGQKTDGESWCMQDGKGMSVHKKPRRR